MPRKAKGRKDPSTSDITEANRKAWDQAADYHRRHPQFQRLLDGFCQDGFSCLDPVLTERLSALDLAGKSVVQLCCNNGREILSVKNLGAGKCLGIDQSAAFIAQAEELAAAGKIDCDFLCTDVYELPSELTGRFDLVLITIGVFGWMPDLERFCEVMTGLLRPGGRIAIYEDHPILNMYDSEKPYPCLPSYSYFDNRPQPEECGLDYFGGTQYEAETNYWTVHKFSDILTATIGLNLQIERIEEFAHDVGTWALYENQEHQLPLSIYLQVRKS